MPAALLDPIQSPNTVTAKCCITWDFQMGTGVSNLEWPAVGHLMALDDFISGDFASYDLGLDDWA